MPVIRSYSARCAGAVEGGSGREPALTDVLTSDFWTLIPLPRISQTCSNLFKPFQSYSNPKKNKKIMWPARSPLRRVQTAISAPLRYPPSIAKRTQIKIHNRLTINHKRENRLASFSKTNPFFGHSHHKTTLRWFPFLILNF
jgi:hypothetical protein